MKNTPAALILDSIFICLLGMLVFIPARASATPDYARQTGFECVQCHVDVIGGGPLTRKGAEFLADMKSQGLIRPLTMTQHIVRLIIGYLHMLAAIVWFGTIMYVHILLKPAYASKGLPKGELRLGWLAMISLLITGALLTIARIPSWDMFFTTRFGILLGIKICLYLLMLSSALIVTTYIGPKLRKQKSLVPAMDETGACTIDGLCQFDGKEGRPAYIAYKGTIYDMTGSRLWKNGSHMMKHAAGNDLTAILKTAPHGEDKVLAMPRVGTLLAPSEKPKLPFHMKLFYVFAYMNLILVFVITFVIALMRWW
jgi:predicted heme/steroid binding protein